MNQHEIIAKVDSYPLDYEQKSEIVGMILGANKAGYDEGMEAAKRIYEANTPRAAQIVTINDYPSQRANPDRAILTAGHDVC